MGAWLRFDSTVIKVGFGSVPLAIVVGGAGSVRVAVAPTDVSLRVR